MNTPSIRRLIMGTALIALAPTLAVAGEAAAAKGLNRAQTGATDAITSPVKIVDGINADTAEYGAAGVVTGTVKGGFRAAAQLVTGAVSVGVGAVEVLASPLTKD